MRDREEVLSYECESEKLAPSFMDDRKFELWCAHRCCDRLDTRENREVGKPTAVHKKGTKVVGLHCHPVDPDFFLTCGNDHTVCHSTLAVHILPILLIVTYFV